MLSKKTTYISLRSLLLISGAAFSLAACDLSQNHLKLDREAELEMQDYRDGLASRVSSEHEAQTANRNKNLIPALQPYIANTQEDMKPMPLVSVSVNQTVPLRDLLYEIAQQAQYDLELDPNIRGAIIFTARERPFDLVIDRISKIAGLRYSFEDDILRIEVDTPYNKFYKIDYLNYIRGMKSSISSDISVVSGDGSDTGSGFLSKSESESNFWGELEANIVQILGSARQRSLATRSTPKISATSSNPDVEGVGADSEEYESPDVEINIGELPLDEEETAAPSSSGQDEGSGFSFSLNKQAGIINVYANENAHKEIQEYLDEVRISSTAQVLIEAKILEVSLRDEFSTGINWSTDLGGVVDNFGVQFAAAGNSLASNIVGGINGAITRPATTAAGGVFTGNSNFALGYSGSDIDALVQALSGFGTVKALASPRITAINNQPAALNVATNRVFFEIDVEISNDGGGGNQAEIDSEIKNVPEGVIVQVQPSIDLRNKTISMAVRPTITNIVAVKNDPSIQFVTADAGITDVVSEIPELNVQEIDTVVQMKSGQAIVMGGLLQDRVSSVQEGVPVLGEIPLAGALFRTQNDLVTKTELVIFLKATILEHPSDSISGTDKDFYRKFSSDRRPLRF